MSENFVPPEDERKPWDREESPFPDPPDPWDRGDSNDGAEY